MVQGNRHQQRLLRRHNAHTGQGRLSNIAPDVSGVGNHDLLQDILLLRCISDNDTYTYKRRERHEARALQQDSHTSSRLLLTGKKRRHHRTNERRHRRSRELDNEHIGHAPQEPDTHHLLYRHIDNHKLAAHCFYDSRGTASDLAHERARQNIEKTLTPGTGTVERHHVPARRNIGRT